MSQDSRTYLFGAFVSTRRIAPCTRPMRIPICCNRRNEGVPRYIEGENALKDVSQKQSTKGPSPFSGHWVGSTAMSSIVKLYDTPYTTSTYVYDHIKENLSAWTDEACTIRAKY